MQKQIYDMKTINQNKKNYILSEEEILYFINYNS